MTSDLTFTLFRLGYLVFLWLLVLGAVSTLRRDIFGTVVTPRGKGRKDADRKRRESRHAKTGTAPRNLLLTGGPLVGTIIPLGASPIIIGRSPSSLSFWKTNTPLPSMPGSPLQMVSGGSKTWGHATELSWMTKG